LHATGGYLMYYARTIGKRYGVVVAANVLTPMLRRQEPAGDPQHLSDLRSIETGIPSRLRADDVLVSCARLLGRSPSEFGFRSAEARLLELVPRQKLTNRKRDMLRTMAENSSGCWYAPSIAARKKAVVQMSKLIDQMRNP
jgi:DNA-binding transcriptional LysR family regulator